MHKFTFGRHIIDMAFINGEIIINVTDAVTLIKSAGRFLEGWYLECVEIVGSFQNLYNRIVSRLTVCSRNILIYMSSDFSVDNSMLRVDIPRVGTVYFALKEVDEYGS